MTPLSNKSKARAAPFKPRISAFGRCAAFSGRAVGNQSQLGRRKKRTRPKVFGRASVGRRRWLRRTKSSAGTSARASEAATPGQKNNESDGKDVGEAKRRPRSNAAYRTRQKRLQRLKPPQGDSGLGKYAQRSAAGRSLRRFDVRTASSGGVDRRERTRGGCLHFCQRLRSRKRRASQPCRPAGVARLRRRSDELTPALGGENLPSAPRLSRT